MLTSAQRGTVYVDIIREGQTVSTRAVDVTGGKAEVAVDLTPDLYGTLELHAYKILRTGAITRDTRLVIVDQASDLNVTLTPGADTYRPGEDATLDVQVNAAGDAGADGAGVHSRRWTGGGRSVSRWRNRVWVRQALLHAEAELLQPKYGARFCIRIISNRIRWTIRSCGRPGGAARRRWPRRFNRRRRSA